MTPHKAPLMLKMVANPNAAIIDLNQPIFSGAERRHNIPIALIESSETIRSRANQLA